MTLWGAKRNSPTTRDSFPRFNVTGPDDPLSGNIALICVLVHSRIGAGTPLKSTASWPGFLWPNPRPEITTGLPIGPSVGSRVIGIITVKVTGAVVLYCTGAQQDPSGKGSMEATLTTSGPVIAFDGTFTSIRVSRHCTTSAATPLNCTSLTPKGINVSFMPMLGPKLRPIICTVAPGAASFGETSLTVDTSTVKVPAGLVFLPALTTTGPVTALCGTLTIIRPSSHCSTRPGALFLPKSTALSLVDTNFPNPSPVMVTAMPIGPESGVIAGAADATLVTKTPRSKMPTHPNVFMQRNRVMCENSTYFKRKFRTITQRSQELSRRGNGVIAVQLPAAPGCCRRATLIVIARRSRSNLGRGCRVADSSQRQLRSARVLSRRHPLDVTCNSAFKK